MKTPATKLCCRSKQGNQDPRQGGLYVDRAHAEKLLSISICLAGLWGRRDENDDIQHGSPR